MDIMKVESEVTYVVRIGERKHLMDIMKVERLDWRIPFKEE